MRLNSYRQNEHQVQAVHGFHLGNRLTRQVARAVVVVPFAGSLAMAVERPIMTYWLDSSVDTSTSTGQQIASSMAAAVENYNRYGVFPGPANGSSYPLRVYYSSGVPTAQASGNGSITFGGQRTTRTAQHEMGHVFGAGQHWQVRWLPNATFKKCCRDSGKKFAPEF